jgi:polysaccharide deacetylase family sporulation protein PdaB
MIIRSYKVKPFVIPVLFLLLAGILFYAVFSAAGSAEDAAASVKKLPVYSVDNDDSKQIALTVNCAWGAQDIPEILDTFDKYHIKCTFFVLGVWAEKNPEALKLIYARGHEIANHSYSHKLPSKSSEEQIKEEIVKCNEAVNKIIGITPTFYRAPSGDYTDTALTLAEKLGMTPIQWSVDSLDWMKDKSQSDIVSRVTGKISSGSIILFHNDTNYTAAALPEIIEHLQKEGYQFVTVGDLLLKGDCIIDNNGVQRAG